MKIECILIVSNLAQKQRDGGIVNGTKCSKSKEDGAGGGAKRNLGKRDKVNVELDTNTSVIIIQANAPNGPVYRNRILFKT